MTADILSATARGLSTRVPEVQVRAISLQPFGRLRRLSAVLVLVLLRLRQELLDPLDRLLAFLHRVLDLRAELLERFVAHGRMRFVERCGHAAGIVGRRTESWAPS